MDAKDQAEQQEFLLSQYLDGDLDQAARQQLERRLATDPTLTARLEELRQADRLVQAWAEPVPELDWDRFAGHAAQRRMADDTWRRRRRILRLYAPLSAAAVIAVAATAYFTAGRGRPVEGPTESFAVVSFQRADAWRSAPGQALAQVTFDRTATLETMEFRPPTAVAVAAAGVGPPPTEALYDEATPYF